MGHDSTSDLHEHPNRGPRALRAAVVALTRAYLVGSEDWKVRSILGLADPPADWSDLQIGMLLSARELRDELPTAGDGAALPGDVLDALGPPFDPRERCRMFCSDPIGQDGDQGIDGAKACCAPCRATMIALRPFFKLVASPSLPEEVRDQLHVIMDDMAEGKLHRDRVWVVIRAISATE